MSLEDVFVLPIPVPPFVVFLSRKSISRTRKEFLSLLLDLAVALDAIRDDLEKIRKEYNDIIKAAEVFHRMGSAIFGILKIPENIASIIDSVLDSFLKIEEIAEEAKKKSSS